MLKQLLDGHHTVRDVSPDGKVPLPTEVMDVKFGSNPEPFINGQRLYKSNGVDLVYKEEILVGGVYRIAGNRIVNDWDLQTNAMRNMHYGKFKFSAESHEFDLSEYGDEIFACTGGVLLPDSDEVFFASRNHNSDYYYIYNYEKHTIRTIKKLRRNDNHQGGVLLPNGNVCLMPYVVYSFNVDPEFLNSHIVVIDPKNNTIVQSKEVPFLVGDFDPDTRYQYGGAGVYIPSIDKVMAPHGGVSDARYLPLTIFYDYKTNTIEVRDVGFDADMTFTPWSLIRTKDNKVLYANYYNDFIHAYDADSDTFYKRELSENLKPVVIGGTLTAGGQVFTAGYLGGVSYLIEPNTLELIKSYPISGFCSAHPLPDGRVVCIPFLHDKVTVLDLWSGEYEEYSIGIPNVSYYGSVMLPNGKILLIPSGTNKVMLLDLGFGAIYPKEELLDPLYNTY